MKITTNMIREADKTAQFFCIDQTFDYVDILNFSSKPDIRECENILYCLTRSETSDDESWYGVKFDRVNHPDRLKPKQTLLTEKFIEGVESQIVVSDVFDCLRKLHKLVLAQVAPKVIG